jgi:hypothetical protein
VRTALVVCALAGCGRVDFAARDAAGRADVAGSAADGPPAVACTAHPTLSVPLTGLVSGDLAAPSTDQGSCGGAATAEDVYAIDVTDPGTDLLLALDASDTTPSAIALYARTDCANTATELACDLVDGIDEAPEIHLTSLAAGRYYAFADGVAPGHYDGTMQILHPAGAACVSDGARDRCGTNLTCTTAGSVSTCAPSACTIGQFLSGSMSYSLTVDTTTGTNLHGGNCGAAGDGGLRAPEVLLQVTIGSAVSDMVVSTDNTGTTYDTLIYVRAGCDSADIACDDDGGAGIPPLSGTTSIAHTGPLPASTYLVFIDGFGTKAGTADVAITLTP